MHNPTDAQMVVADTRLHKKWKLENPRVETLPAIAGERVNAEAMAQRPRPPDDIRDDLFLETVLKRLAKMDARARNANIIDDLDDLAADAEIQGQFRAYLCPVAEIHTEGELVIDVIEGRAFPKAQSKGFGTCSLKSWKRPIRTRLQPEVRYVPC
jgi:hypothetical protein